MKYLFIPLIFFFQFSFAVEEEITSWFNQESEKFLEIMNNSDGQNNENYDDYVKFVEKNFAVKSIAYGLIPESILSKKPDGIFLSNGPGDPQKVFNNIKPELKKILESKIPTFGICLGHQILSLAFNAKTKRMDKGHRGGNHPVKNLETGQVEITSQNHGFVVSNDDFPNDLEISHISLFDNTVDGMKSKSQPLFSVQYHPESSPGPHDSRYLFDKFIELMKSNAS